MKEFIFLYPIPEYINHSIKNNDFDEENFREIYSEKLNKSIDERYRQKGFGVNYVIFDGHEISDVVKTRKTDRIIEAGVDFKTHTTKQVDGSYIYPNPDDVLNRLGNLSTVRVAGFHLWDCVEKMARRAHQRGCNVLVDEDLTELFGAVIRDENFRTDRYPNYNPRKHGSVMFDMFMSARKGVPWLWQEY